MGKEQTANGWPLAPTHLPLILPPSPFYAERSACLPETYWCYEPPADVPAVAPTPAMANGFITFGCLNNFAKVSPATRTAWAAILRAVPRSRLVLHAKDGQHRQRVQAEFADAGVEPERISFLAMLPLVEYFPAYGRIDLALDPFPYGGGTTTFDALWMGVPVVTLRGQTAVGRGGVSILSNLGLPELIADDVTMYAEVATRLASDVATLDALRQSLRPRLRTSCLTDGPRFVRNLERIFQRIALRGQK
jgi:predicted O-linked N-acetylglucosamine transferase (SPINDLY family)